MEERLQKKEVDRICKILIDVKIQDKFVWHFINNRIYSVRSGYNHFVVRNLIEASPSSNIMEAVWKNLWNLSIPRKIKIFIWRAIHNIIPTNLNLHNRGMDIPQECPRFPFYCISVGIPKYQF